MNEKGKEMISKDKQYRTRDGREVRIYATDGRALQEVQGAILENNGWEVRSWDKHGFWVGGDMEYHPADLIEVRPRHKRTVWLNVYHYGVSRGYETKEGADADATKNCRIACITVDLDFEEGEGL